ncbi:unnamed protein product [Linum tenue]|uniref:Uncharacterized protein n=1 Tax=Linum tenue TaxID=586396 RepID=A0AAV0HVM6_9ROSI|nr:unnamed protein product [Linum tenue]
MRIDHELKDSSGVYVWLARRLFDGRTHVEWQEVLIDKVRVSLALQIQ